jgi:hypothetical protein
MEEKHSALRVTVSTLEGEVVDVFLITLKDRVEEVKRETGEEEVEVVGNRWGIVFVDDRLRKGLE